VPQHAERASICYTSKNAGAFAEVLEKRLPHLAATGQARVRKLLKKLYDLRIVEAGLCGSVLNAGGSSRKRTKIIPAGRNP